MQGVSHSTQYYLKFGNYAKCHEQFFIPRFTSHMLHTKRLKLDLRLISISLHFCLLFLLSCQIPRFNENWPQGSTFLKYPYLEARWHKHCHITSSNNTNTPRSAFQVLVEYFPPKISAWLGPKFINSCSSAILVTLLDWWWSHISSLKL